MPPSPPQPQSGKLQFLQQCHISKDFLEDKEIMIFFKETQHGQLKKMQWVLLTDESTKLHQDANVQRLWYNIGMDEFLALSGVEWICQG